MKQAIIRRCFAPIDLSGTRETHWSRYTMPWCLIRSVTTSVRPTEACFVLGCVLLTTMNSVFLVQNSIQTFCRGLRGPSVRMIDGVGLICTRGLSKQSRSEISTAVSAVQMTQPLLFLTEILNPFTHLMYCLSTVVCCGTACTEF